MSEKSLRELDLEGLIAGRRFFPSPQHWEDEVLYFLMVDRFSDGAENLFCDNSGRITTNGATPPFVPGANGNAVRTESDAARWRDAGAKFVGGTLSGMESKLGYLQRLGVTAIWISPVFKQVRADGTYHGYGIQNFLDVDPNFGSREDLRRLVQTAHGMGIRVILDIILNHCGDVFRYRDGDPAWSGRKFPVGGFRDNQGSAGLPFGPIDPADLARAFPDGAIWPAEFQRPETFTGEGRIRNFDFFPEFADGDFFSLKDLHHGERRIADGVDAIDEYSVSSTLRELSEVYKFWIAFADVDGFRLDTVKHMDPGAARFFASVIHEFAEALGKENFYIIGEITGGREFAFERLEVTGLDAALGISDERGTMTALVQGETDPAAYFDLFRNSLLVRKDSHAWFRDKLVTSVDDHDHVDQGEHKRRFCAGGFEKLALAVLALNATTMGIPCIYYGTEQLFDGEGAGNRPTATSGRRCSGASSAPSGREAIIASTRTSPSIASSPGSTGSGGRSSPCAGAASTSVRSPATARTSASPRESGRVPALDRGLVPDLQRPGGARRDQHRPGRRVGRVRHDRRQPARRRQPPGLPLLDRRLGDRRDRGSSSRGTGSGLPSAASCRFRRLR